MLGAFGGAFRGAFRGVGAVEQGATAQPGADGAGFVDGLCGGV